MTDWQVYQTMMTLGGSFVQALATAFERADLDNQRRIKAAFPELWAQYTELAEMREKRQRELNQQQG